MSLVAVRHGRSMGVDIFDPHPTRGDRVLRHGAAAPGRRGHLGGLRPKSTSLEHLRVFRHPGGLGGEVEGPGHR